MPWDYTKWPPVFQFYAKQAKRVPAFFVSRSTPGCNRHGSYRYSMQLFDYVDVKDGECDSVSTTTLV